MSRISIDDLSDAVEGFVPDHVFLEWHGPGGGAEASTARVVATRLRQTRRLTAHEVTYLKAHASGPIKMSVPCRSNYVIGSYKPGVSELVYHTHKALLHEMTGIIRREIEALLAEGVAYVQLDAPFYAHSPPGSNSAPVGSIQINSAPNRLWLPMPV
jgi:5-methyltetrahydropteroyltriglutamate--homocysteine methyltransferase